MTLPTNRTTQNTAFEHVADHNTLHQFHNDKVWRPYNGTDDTVSLNNYASDLNTVGGGVVHLGPYTYKISGSLDLYNDVVWQGTSRGGTIIEVTGSSAAFANDTPTVDIESAYVRDLTIKRVSGTITNAVEWYHVVSGGLVRVAIENFVTVGIDMDDSDGNFLQDVIVDGPATSIAITGTSTGNRLIGPHLLNATTGISFEDTADDNSVLWPYDVSVTTLSSDTSSGTNVVLTGGLGSPGAHATTHSDGGADEINVIDLGSGAQASGSVVESDGSGGLQWGTGGTSNVGYRQLFLTMGG